MKEGFALVKFSGDKVVKIAPFYLIRHQNKAPFEPVSARDIPQGPAVQVKWEKSMSGSFCTDGFYEAEVLAVASSVQNLLDKAKSLRVRLPQNYMIDLPVARNSISASGQCGSGDSSSRRNNREKPGSSRSSVKHDSNVKTKDRKGSREPPSRSKNSSESSFRKPKSHHVELPKPSLPAGTGSSKKRNLSHSDSCTDDEFEESPEIKGKKKPKVNKIANDPVSSRRLDHSRNLSLVTNPLVKKTADEGKKSLMSQGSPSVEGFRASSTPKDLKHWSAESFSNPCKDLVSKNLFGVDDGTSSANFQNGAKDNLSRSKVTCDGGEENVEGLDADKPEHRNGSNLDDTLPLYEELGSDSDTEIPLKDQYHDSDASSDDDHDSIGHLKKVNEGLEKKAQHYKDKAAEYYRQMVLSNNLRITYKSKVEKMEKRNVTLQDLLTQMTADGPIASKHKSQSHNSRKQKNLKGGRMIAVLRDDKLNITKDKVLAHLKNEKKLEEDSQGLVDIGNDVCVNLDQFELNFEDNKLDPERASKNLTAMTWTLAERCGRSLEGGTSNKHPEATPKKAATPSKVAAVLGSVKAHLINSGDVEGPAMSVTLLKCRKAIGSKFSVDAYREKLKRTDD